MMLLMRLALGVVLLAVTRVSATEWARLIGQVGDQKPFPLDIRLGRDTMTSIPGEKAENIRSSCYRRSVNFHDFSRRLVAMKDVDRETCDVKRTDETHADVRSTIDRFRRGQQHVIKQREEYWIRPRKSLKPDEIVQTVGPRIAEFCRDYDTYLLTPGTAERDNVGLHRRGVPKEEKSKPCERNCVFCVVSVRDQSRE